MPPNHARVPLPIAHDPSHHPIALLRQKKKNLLTGKRPRARDQERFQRKRQASKSGIPQRGAVDADKADGEAGDAAANAPFERCTVPVSLFLSGLQLGWCRCARIVSLLFLFRQDLHLCVQVGGYHWGVDGTGVRSDEATGP